MEQTRQKRTAKVLLAALLSVVMALALVFAILPQATLTAQADDDDGFTAATMAAGSNAGTCTVNGDNGVKVGTNSSAGNMTVTVPAGATVLRVYVAAWANSGVEPTVEITSSTSAVISSSIVLTADAGITNSSPFTLSGSKENYKFDLNLSGVTEETVFTFASSVFSKRFVLWDAQYKTSAESEPVQAEEPAYYLWGSMMNWNREDRSIPFSATETDGVYSVTNVSFSEGDEFKVLAVLGEFDFTYPDGMDNAYTVEADGTYNVYFRPEGNGGDGWHEGYIKVEAASTETTVKYLDETGAEKTVESVTAVTASPTWGAADTETWYVADGKVEISSRITVAGTVNLILADGCELKANAGITTTGATLNIFAQIEGETAGKLTATGSNGAGIGSLSSENAGTLNIYGGKITATGANSSAGIGGGSGSEENPTDGGKINIYGGEVTATGGRWAAGIGGGYLGTSGKIVILGGTVIATGGQWAAGIGGYYGVITADITIGEGLIVKTGADENSAVKVSDFATAHDQWAKVFEPTVVDLSTLTDNYTAQDDEILTGTLGGNYKLSIAAGATVTLKNAIINGENDISYSWAGITCLGDATIILEGENTVKGFYEEYSGIYVSDGKTLTIEGEGTLSASSNGYAAGIGANGNSGCGNIVINDGVINATGGSGAAGIGGSVCSPCGDITINGGTVTATGSVGIGAGNKDSCGDITISGGNVTATGGNNGTGIGSGFQGSCGAIAISGGTVTATGGDDGAGIGSGCDGECGDITISDATVTATGGSNGAGIGGGATGTCGNITIANTVTKVTATKGENATNSIGIGNGGSCGTVTIGGVEGAITESPYTYPPLVDLSTLTADYVAQDGEILTGTLGGNYKLSIAAGATVTLDTVTINYNNGAGITCNGDATIILEGANSVRSSRSYYPGIFVPEGKTLTIKGSGSLTANGGQSAAGIGGGSVENYKGDCGKIVIESGTINAYGGWGSSAIGSAPGFSCDGIEIKGGIVNAYGGEDGGVGIGSGDGGWCEYITISGGKIYAEGTAYEYDWGSAGIGSSFGKSSCGNITISGGNITAKGGTNSAAIGAGSGYLMHWDDEVEDEIQYSCCGDITITDGVGKLTATKGNGSSQTIGGGKYSECGNVSVAGVNGAVTTSPYTYISEGPSGVIVLIDEIPNPVVVNNACRNAIAAARAAYDKLETEDQKALVTNYSVLTAAEAVFAVEDANAKLDAIPDDVDEITLDDKETIEAARAAYNALTEAQKGEIDTGKVNKLTAAETKYAALKEADDTAKARDVSDKIDALPAANDITVENKAAIEAARAAYDALTEDQLAKLTDLEGTLAKLEAAEEALAAAEKDVADQQAANAVVNVIDDLPEEVTVDDKTAIEAARAAYDALTADQLAKLTDPEGTLAKLTAAEAALAAAEKDVADQQAANAASELIDALPEEVTVEDKTVIEAARAAYNALTEDQLAKLTDPEGTLAKLTNAETAYAAAKKEADDTAAANAVKEKIAAIGTVEYTADSKAAIDEAKTAYEALTDDQKALVDNTATLTAAETTYATLKADNDAAEAVVAKIAAIGTVEYTADSKAAIDEAKAAYDALTDEQKALVDNANVLTSAEQTYATKEAEANKGLSGGAIAGIVIGSVFALLIIACAVLFILNKKGILHIAFLDKFGKKN